ncbi:unnamed protein product [Cuscuta europaea]|uniref:Uncharacterized protein n=1 Tax=Cuscuta europaea TaxID=41803 RepID=A0A9P1EGY9_CUSEU|nr:unnamed protein product [Cuscuta europaea]
MKSTWTRCRGGRNQTSIASQRNEKYTGVNTGKEARIEKSICVNSELIQELSPAASTPAPAAASKSGAMGSVALRSGHGSGDENLSNHGIFTWADIVKAGKDKILAGPILATDSDPSSMDNSAGNIDTHG